MRVRPALARDQDGLKSLQCSDGSDHQDDVERWFRTQALPWSFAHADNHVLVLVEPTEEEAVERVLGAIAYEPGVDPNEWFIRALAISGHIQGQKHGRRMLTTCLNSLAQDYPGWVAYWKVDPDNKPSIRMSHAVNADRDFLYGSKFVNFSVVLQIADVR